MQSLLVHPYPRYDTDEEEDERKVSFVNLSEWRDEGGLYVKSFFQAPIPRLTTTQPTQVKLMDDGTRFSYVIDLTCEIRHFLAEVEEATFRSPLI